MQVKSQKVKKQVKKLDKKESLIRYSEKEKITGVFHVTSDFFGKPKAKRVLTVRTFQN